MLAAVDASVGQPPGAALSSPVRISATPEKTGRAPVAWKKALDEAPPWFVCGVPAISLNCG